MRYNPYYTRPQQRAGFEDLGAASAGAAQGAQLGPIGAAVGAGVGLYGSTLNRITEANQLAQQPVLGLNQQYDSSIDPTYQGGQYLQAQEQISTLGESEQGLRGTGAKIGILGGIPGLIAGGFSQRARRRLSNRQNELTSQIESSQQAFNEASQAFEQREIAQADYRRKRNMTNRLYNLYNTGGQQQFI